MERNIRPANITWILRAGRQPGLLGEDGVQEVRRGYGGRQKRLAMTRTVIRSESPEDGPGVRQVNELAFGQPAEADIVDRCG